MSQRSKVMDLPEDIREQLDRQLLQSGFQGYVDLSDWLREQGYKISKSSLHRYGSEYERKLESVRLSTEMATALIKASPDDAGAMADASLRLVQDRMFDLLLKSEDGDLKGVANAARAIAETARASATIRAERRKVLQEAQEKVKDVARSHGLSDDVMNAIDEVLMPNRGKD